MGSISGLVKRFHRSISNEEYYVAEQTCRTIYHRLTHPRDPSTLDLPYALEQLFTGALTLLEKDRAEEGSALALLAVKHLKDYKVGKSFETMKQLRTIAMELERIAKKKMLNQDNPNREEERNSILKEKIRYLRGVVDWTKDEEVDGANLEGDEWANCDLGRTLQELGEYKDAMYCFLNSNTPAHMAELVNVWTKKTGLKSEQDLFLCRVILLYLSRENLQDANATFDDLMEIWKWKNPHSRQPLANFCELLLLTVQHDKKAAKLYQRLVNTYKKSLERDPELMKLTNEVGEIYFSVQQQRGGNPLFSMLGQMMGAR